MMYDELTDDGIFLIFYGVLFFCVESLFSNWGLRERLDRMGRVGRSRNEHTSSCHKLFMLYKT